MKLEYLKIKYVFIEGRNPNKDLDNAIDTLTEDVFVGSFYEYILPEVIGKTEDKFNKDDLEYAIEFFTLNLEDHLKDESVMLRKLMMHPQVIKQLKQRIKEIME